MRIQHFLTLIMIVLSGVFFACDKVDNIKDCKDICGKYKDCIDGDYDVGACEDRCEDNSEDDEDFEHQVDTCDACLEDQSCGEAFDCVDECVGIVP